MRLRDISIKRRIMLANFAMVLVPLCLLIPIVGLLLNGLHHSSAARLTELTWLWPEKGPMLTVQYHSAQSTRELSQILNSRSRSALETGLDSVPMMFVGQSSQLLL